MPSPRRPTRPNLKRSHAQCPAQSLARGWLQKYRIGHIASPKETSVLQDFDAMRRSFAERGLMEASGAYYAGKMVELLILSVIGATIIWTYPQSFAALLIAAVVVGCLLSQLGWAQHDFNHNQVSNSENTTQPFLGFISYILYGRTSSLLICPGQRPAQQPHHTHGRHWRVKTGPYKCEPTCRASVMRERTYAWWPRCVLRRCFGPVSSTRLSAAGSLVWAWVAALCGGRTSTTSTMQRPTSSTQARLLIRTSTQCPL